MGKYYTKTSEVHAWKFTEPRFVGIDENKLRGMVPYHLLVWDKGQIIGIKSSISFDIPKTGDWIVRIDGTEVRVMTDDDFKSEYIPSPGVKCATITPKEAVETLKAAFAADQDYANSWHDNIACCVMDAGLNHERANDAASRFMKLAFDVKTENPTHRHLGDLMG